MALSTLEHFCTIRLMEDEDVVDVHRIEQASYEFPWSEGIFRDCLRAGYHCLVAEQDLVVVGYGVLLLAGGDAHVLNLCMTEAVRGHGFSRRLLEDMRGTAERAGAGQMFLEVRPSNGPAIALYAAFGFNEIGRRPDYYDAKDGREDAIVMGLALRTLRENC